MNWYHYLAAVFAGFCIANAVPHGVAGMMGETFPSPFGDPPSIGHSSALVNVLWALTNLVVGYLSFRFARVTPDNGPSMLFLLLGVAVAAILCSLTFSGTLSFVDLQDGSS